MTSLPMDAPPPNTEPSRFVGFFSSPLLVAGLVIVAGAVLIAALAPSLSPLGGTRINFPEALRPPLAGWHLMGTDQLGRDIFLRVASALRISFSISLSAVGLALVVGLCIGLVSGYFGGWVDTILMRFTDIQMALPFIVLAVAILSVATPGYLSLTVVLSLAAWPTYARVIRSTTRIERNEDHVQAAIALGASHGRILIRYLARAIIVPTVVLSILDLAAMIIYEATLTFIAIGVPPGVPSLGSIMADGKNYIATAWWITAMPGLAILIVIAGLNMLAVGFRQKTGMETRR
ncbi:peptide ABC transporter permease [Labrys miyagiensis]